MKCFAKTMTATGQVYTGSCWFVNMKIGMDNANDQQITVSDSAGAPSGATEIVPTNPYDASAMGLNGISGDATYCRYGVYLTIEDVGGGAAQGNCEVTIGIWPAVEGNYPF